MGTHVIIRGIRGGEGIQGMGPVGCDGALSHGGNRHAHQKRNAGLVQLHACGAAQPPGQNQAPISSHHTVCDDDALGVCSGILLNLGHGQNGSRAQVESHDDGVDLITDGIQSAHANQHTEIVSDGEDVRSPPTVYAVVIPFPLKGAVSLHTADANLVFGISIIHGGCNQHML